MRHYCNVVINKICDRIFYYHYQLSPALLFVKVYLCEFTIMMIRLLQESILRRIIYNN